MKKLLAVLMVLSIATVANAGLTIGGAPQGPINPSDTAVISVISDGLTLQDQEFYISITGPGTSSVVGAINNVNSNATGESIIDISEAGNGTLIFMDLASPQVPSPVIPEGIAVDQIIFHCEGPGEVTLTLYGNTTGVFDTVVIQQIPEPITMGLLGLGGLFLRRRK